MKTPNHRATYLDIVGCRLSRFSNDPLHRLSASSDCGNNQNMIDIKQIKALSAREAEITETLTFAKKELDKTGSAVLPYSLYHALCEERKQIREQLEQMMK